MKVFAVNITRTYGTSMKKNPKGQEYDIASMQILVPMENGGGDTKDGGQYTRTGYGFQVTELSVASDCLEQFKDIQFPAHLEVSTDSEMRFGRMQMIVSGLIVPPASADITSVKDYKAAKAA